MDDTIDLHFPFAGTDVAQAVGKQPNRPALPEGKYARTTFRGQNVRAYDALGRARGGQRQGLVKYLASRPGNVRYATQYLGTLTTSGIPAPGGGSVQPSQSGRLQLIVAVSQGNVYSCPAGGTTWTIAANATASNPPLIAAGLVRASDNTQLKFFADGTHQCYFDPASNTVKPWTLTAGNFPVDNQGNTAKLTCTWLGRTVQAGFLNDPALITMSAISAPFDYNYNPSVPVPASAAWSGHVGPQGTPGDPVTAVIPYTDDNLIIGMSNSISLFRGDPNYGGRVDPVTKSIGIVWGEAWAIDPSGVVYFMSNRTGIFKYVPGATPERISVPIDPLLVNIDTGQYGVRMEWNDRYKQLHVFVTLLGSSFTATHFTWESLSGAWWTDTFQNTDFNPLCTTVLDGNLASDRLVLVAGFDGYVRSLSSSATDDDGQSILSEVWIGPFLTQYGDSVILKELQAILGASGGTVNYDIFIGQTAEQALASSSISSGTWSAGRNLTALVRRAGYAAYIRLTSPSAWACETIRCTIDALGKVRRRGTIG